MRYFDKLSERIRIYFCYLKDEYSVTFVQIIPYETLSARCDLKTLAFGLRLKNSTWSEDFFRRNLISAISEAFDREGVL